MVFSHFNLGLVSLRSYNGKIISVGINDSLTIAASRWPSEKIVMTMCSACFRVGGMEGLIDRW